MMIKKKGGNEPDMNDRNFLSAHTGIKGDIVTQGILRIDGTVEGNITVKGRLILGAQAKVIGNVTCDYLEVEGSLTGDCEVKETLALKEKAIVNGNMAYGNISIDLGAQFTGTSKIIKTS